MNVAQPLYEGVDLGPEGTVGLITYMRTDSVRVAESAQHEARDFIAKTYGAVSVPDALRVYRSRRSAQDAHEAIRPTAVHRTPERMKPFLRSDQFKVYKLIWDRFVASQMASAVMDTLSVDIVAGEYQFRATGSRVKFVGFLAVYHDLPENGEEQEGWLPDLATGEVLTLASLDSQQHFTQPPPRYTEASLVRALEERGIGRPSTYASIISTLQDREYVVLEKKRFQPTDVGRLVNCFLTRHLTHYVDHDFTAKLEDKLDDVSNGKRVWTRLLGEFWKAFDSDLKTKQDVERGCPILETCPKCGKPLFMQASKRGLFRS